MEKVDAVKSKSGTNENPKLWTKDFIFICLSSFFLFLAFHSMIPTLPIYMERFGGGASGAGLPLAALTIGAVLTRPVTGWALDVYGRKAIFFGGLLLFLIPVFFYIWMIPAYFLIIMRFFQGMGWGIGNTASSTVASDIVPLRRMGEGMGIFTLTLTLPMAVSPAISLWVLDRYSFSLLFGITSLLTLLSIMFVFFIRFPRQEKQKIKPKFNLLEKSGIKPALVILMFTISYSSMLSFLPVYALSQNIESTGLFYTAFALATLMTRPLSGMFVDRKGEKGFNLAIATGCICICIALIIVARASLISHLIMGGILYGIGFGMGQPTIHALCIRSAPPQKRGAANATYWTAYDVGIFLGSIIWGLVVTLAGYHLMFYLNILPITIALIIHFMPYRNKKQGLVEEKDPSFPAST
ncbi:MAG: MFS transporter [Bacillota bacterium]